MACYITSLDFPGQLLTIWVALQVFLTHSFLWEWETKHFHTNDAATHSSTAFSSFPDVPLWFCEWTSWGGKKQQILKKANAAKHHPPRQPSAAPCLLNLASYSKDCIELSHGLTSSVARSHTRLAFLWEGWSVPPWQPAGPEWAPAASALKSTVRGGKAL